jgi:hypothetical protein
VNNTDEGGSGQLLPHSTMVLVPQRRSMPLVSGDEVQALLLLNVQSSQGGAVWLHYDTTYVLVIGAKERPAQVRDLTRLSVSDYYGSSTRSPAAGPTLS